MPDNLLLDSDFVHSAFDREAEGESLPVTLPSGTTFVSTVNGLAGSVSFSGGSTGLTFSGAGSTVSLAGTLAIANGGTGATSAAAARSNLSAAASGNNSDVTKLLGLTGGLRLIGYTSSAGDPTTTELPADKDLAVHKNTASGNVFLAFNNGGAAIVKVQLT